MINQSAVADMLVTADITLLYMHEKNTKDMVIRCAEDKGWQVHTSKSQAGDALLFEFSKFTPAGQDFSFCASMKDDSLYSFIREVEGYYEGFDPDEEAYLWLDGNGHGKNGAPYRMKDVLADMEAAEAMVKELLDALAVMESGMASG